MANHAQRYLFSNEKIKHSPTPAVYIRMKKLALLIVFAFCGVVLFGQNLPYLPEPSFKAGEKIQYKLKLGIFNAATATVTVNDSKLKFGPVPAYHLTVDAGTVGAFSLYTVKNKYDSYINKKTYLPYLYTENIREGSYRRVEYASFNHQAKTVTGKKGTFNSQTSQFFDLVSAYYFCRNIDLSSLNKGDMFKITYFLNEEVAQLGVEYIGIETIKTSLGQIECIKLRPEISPGRIFKKDSKLYLWVTNDGNRIPVKAHVEIKVGSVSLELVKAEGLKHPLGKRVSYSK